MERRTVPSSASHSHEALIHRMELDPGVQSARGRSQATAGLAPQTDPRPSNSRATQRPARGHPFADKEIGT